MIEFVVILILLIIVALPLFSLNKANINAEARHMQLWSPVMAMLFTGLAYYLYWKGYHQYFDSFIFDLLARFNITFPWLERISIFIAGFVATVTYVTIKKFINYWLVGASRYYTNDWEKYQEITPTAFVNLLYSLFDIFGIKKEPDFIYKVYDEEYIALKRFWEFAAQFFLWISIVTAAVYTVSLVCIPYYDLVPPILILPLICFLEFYWYLNGPKVKSETNIDTDIDIPQIKNNANRFNLWEEYQKEWENQLLFAWHYKGKENFENIQQQQKSELSLKGYELTEREHTIYQHLSNDLDVIIPNVRYNEIRPVLFTHLLSKVLNGEHILIITPHVCFETSEYHKAVLQWLNEGLQELSGNDIFWSANIYDRTRRGQLDEDIIISSADDLLEHQALHHEWFDDLHTIIFIYTVETFASNPSSNNILLKAIKDRNQAIQSITMMQNRRGGQESVKRNFEVSKAFEEVKTLTNEAEETFLLFWKLEDKAFQSQLLQGRIDSYLGAEVPLSLLAWREQIQPIEIVDQKQLPFYEYIEQTDNNRNRIVPEHIPPERLTGNINEQINCVQHSLFNKKHDDAFLLARDTEYNLITALEKWNSFGVNTSFLHIVSPPYLLREYFVSNLEYFKSSPIYALTAYLMNTSRFSVALSLLERMIIKPMPEEQIRFELAKIHMNKGEVVSLLRQLFIQAFNIDVTNAAWLDVDAAQVYNQQNNRFESVYTYSLNENIKSQIQLTFLKQTKVVDQYDSNVLRILPHDQVYQNYLPGQLHAFGGRLYEIEDFDKTNFCLRADNEDPKESFVIYRPDVDVSLKSLMPPFSSDIQQPQGGAYIALREATFTTRTKGYFSFLSGIHLKNENKDFRYVSLENKNIPLREYPMGRVVQLHFKHKLEGIDNDKLNTTLCILLKELFVTLFPEMHQYLVVSSPSNKDILDEHFDQLYNVLNVDASINQQLANEHKLGDKNVVSILIFEDVHRDLGLVNSIFKEWRYIFEILSDYLNWLNTTPVSDVTVPDTNQPLQKGDYRKGKIHPRSFLKYGLNIDDAKTDNSNFGSLRHFPAFLDLAATAEFLEYILGRNELTDERDTQRGKRKKVYVADGKHQCDYCGKTYHNSQLEQFEDGRERCATCKSTGIDDRAALDNVMKDVQTYFKAIKREKELAKEVKLIFASSQKIAEHRGHNFIPTPKFDPRTMGLAIRDEEGNYSIWIENGQPYHSCLAVAVHEMTHIWQYVNLDFLQMKKDWGLHLIEGHTIWTEIDCLERKYKEDPDQRYLDFIDLEKNRKDLYGEGYHLVLKLLKKNGHKDPFKYLMETYRLK